MTHGAFDLFHISHLDLLQKAAEECDFLVVGVDSDTNIIKYKDYKRPIIPQEDRLEIISELNCVDAVFINRTRLANEAYMNLYRKFNINKLIIGKGKFGFEKQVEDEAKAIKIKLIKIKTKQPSVSTTSIINSIIKAYIGKSVSGRCQFPVC